MAELKRDGRKYNIERAAKLILINRLNCVDVWHEIDRLFDTVSEKERFDISCNYKNLESKIHQSII